MRRAIVTTAIGAAYENMWRKFCQRNWEAYAARHGYEVIVQTQPLDSSERAQKRSPSWQKCLIFTIPELANCDRVIWVDSDVVINPSAPNVAVGVPQEAVGAIDENAFPTREKHQAIVRRLVEGWTMRGRPDLAAQYMLTPQAFYESWGLPGTFSHIVQAGVLVLSPAHHRSIFEHVYNTYEDKGDPRWNYEMRPLSYEILKAGKVHWLDPRFNALLPFLWEQMHAQFANEEQFVNAALVNCYMIHFAGVQRWMELITNPGGV